MSCVYRREPDCQRHRQLSRDHVHSRGAGLPRRRYNSVQNTRPKGRFVDRQWPPEPRRSACCSAGLLIGEQVAFADLIGIAPVALGIYLVTRPAALAPGMVVERMLDGHGSCDRWDMSAASVVSSKWRDRCDR